MVYRRRGGGEVGGDEDVRGEAKGGEERWTGEVGKGIYTSETTYYPPLNNLLTYLIEEDDSRKGGPRPLKYVPAWKERSGRSEKSKRSRSEKEHTN